MTKKLERSGSLWILCLMCASVSPGQEAIGAGGEGFLLLDVYHKHSENILPNGAYPRGGKAFSYFEIPPGTPDDWISPLDYSQGTIHMRLEVFSKPSDLAVKYQICLFQDRHTAEKHACARLLTFDATGLYRWEQDFTRAYQHDNLDWSRPLLDQMLVVKDGSGKPVDDRFGFAGGWEGSPDFSLYYPMEVRFSAIMVPAGGTFAPPSWWTIEETIDVFADGFESGRLAAWSEVLSP